MIWRDENNLRNPELRILLDGGIHLYHRQNILESDLKWFEDEGYLVCSLDFSEIESLEEFYRVGKNKLQLTYWSHQNLDAFNDSLYYLDIDNIIGIVFVFLHYDSFASRFPEESHFILDKISVASRRYLIDGKKFIALVQSDNTQISFPAVGLCYISWNFRDQKEGLQ